jgi:hypothetical protein
MSGYFIGAMEETFNPLPVYSSDEEEIDNLADEVIEIPICEGIPRRLWMTQVVDLHNEAGGLVAQGICHSVNSDLVIGSNGPLGDSLVAVQISKSLNAEDVPDDWKYSLRAWPIVHVFLNGASLHDHELRDAFNCKQASLLRPPSVGKRPYVSVRRRPHVESGVKVKELLTQ